MRTKFQRHLTRGWICHPGKRTSKCWTTTKVFPAREFRGSSCFCQNGETEYLLQRWIFLPASHSSFHVTLAGTIACGSSANIDGTLDDVGINTLMRYYMDSNWSQGKGSWRSITGYLFFLSKNLDNRMQIKSNQNCSTSVTISTSDGFAEERISWIYDNHDIIVIMMSSKRHKNPDSEGVPIILTLRGTSSRRDYGHD